MLRNSIAGKQQETKKGKETYPSPAKQHAHPCTQEKRETIPHSGTTLEATTIPGSRKHG